MDPIQFSDDTAAIVWFFVSLPLIITVFFRFGRVWSLRNFDLIVLLNVAAGIVVMRHVDSISVAGIAWMLSSTGLLLVRLLSDGVLKKRPRIDPNLQPHAMVFLGLCGTAVVTYAIAVLPLPPSSRQTVEDGRSILTGDAAEEPTGAKVATSGPATTIAAAPVVEVSKKVTGEDDAADDTVAQVAVGIFAGLGHLAIIAGLIFINYRHFSDVPMGIVMATLYLLLPSTVLDPNSVGHIVSAALVLWALAMHRTPWAAGILMGLACGSLLYPAFLLPVWFAFYGRKRGLRFAVAMLSVWSALLLAVALSSADVQSYLKDSLRLVAGGVTFLVNGQSPVTWRITNEIYRWPIVGTFLVMLIALTVWPREKRFEHLLAATAAVIVGIQFWYPQQFGEYMTGYIPMVVLVTFRPRLHQPVMPQPRTLRTDDRHESAPSRREPALTGAGTFSVFR